MGDTSDEANAMDDFERVKTENLLKQEERDRKLAQLREDQKAAELANRLLNDGQAAPGSRGPGSGKSAASASGARTKAAGVRGAKPALEH